MKEIVMWYCRNFKVIKREKAIEWGLSYKRSIYGDAINKLNCRSLWADSKGRLYRVKSIK